MLYVKRLKQKARDAKTSLGNIRNAVQKLVEELPTLEPENIEVKSKWVRQLFNEVLGENYGRRHENADSFLTSSMIMRQVLIDAFHLFHPPHVRNWQDNILERLERLKTSCLTAREYFGDQTSDISLTPKDIIKEAKKF